MSAEKRTCWICGRALVVSTEDNRTLVCSLHGTRGTAHLRPAARSAAGKDAPE